MSRSGYSDDYSEGDAPPFLWRQSVENAINGKRGQLMLRDLLAALDAMPNKRLIAEDLIRDGEVCAIGALGVVRGIDLQKLDPERPGLIAKSFGIAEALVREIEFYNDEFGAPETPEQRWERMRHWVASQIKSESVA
jgi:hypothetical protein